MPRRMHSSVIAAAITVALLAGCGGGGGSASSTTSSTRTAAAKTHQTTSSATAPISSSNTTSSVPTNPGSPGSGAAVAVYCQSLLGAAKGLSSTEKGQFKSYCASLAHDNPTQIKGAEKNLCDEVIKDTVPASEQSLAKSECAKL
jgi:hypothetical protein